MHGDRRDRGPKGKGLTDGQGLMSEGPPPAGLRRCHTGGKQMEKDPLGRPRGGSLPTPTLESGLKEGFTRRGVVEVGVALT